MAQPALDDETRKSTLEWRESPPLRSSDESNETGVAVDNWFEKSNKNVGGKFGPAFVDNDPPYFQPQHSHRFPQSVSDAQPMSLHQQGFEPPTSQYAPGFFHQPTNRSSADDFRSVIDDLTIENKKLKERLRKYEKCYSPHLEKDKLFEVKVHGLSQRKKRELEETLRAFASKVTKDEASNVSISQRASKGSRDPPSTLRHSSRNPSSLSTANSRVVDSAYASLSTSGGVGSSTSNNVVKGDGAGGSKAGKVESFLKDTPVGLLPNNSSLMSERAKKKLVVRRLEQLFTGKTRAPAGLYSQPLQQQEVSNSAARDDRQAVESRGQHVSAEGIREACILPLSLQFERPSAPRLQGESSVDSLEGTENGEPDQRPTRPLDLDPDRAQVPAENIEYIRHLGISTPDFALEELTDAEDGHGWVYLNLLINMAQLHIINVTPDFVRSAVTEMSSKFQLSSDGSKIRWRGGTEGTELSSDSGTDLLRQHSSDDSEAYDEGARKRRKLESSPQLSPEHGRGLQQGQISAVPVRAAHESKSAIPKRHHVYYKPLFARRQSTEDEDNSFEMSTSHNSWGVPNDSGSHDSDGIQAGLRRSQSGSSSKRKRGDGAIVFYSGAEFCTDLSKERDSISTPIHVADVGQDGFSNRSHDALGCVTLARSTRSRSSSGSPVGSRPFKDYSTLVKSSDRAQSASSTADEDCEGFSFSPRWSESSNQSPYTPRRLSACGLGGTRPADHFAVIVKTRRRKLDREMRVRLSKFVAGPKFRKLLRRISKSSLDAFRAFEREAGGEPAARTEAIYPVQHEVISTTLHRLEPSSLPPPATFHGEFSSSTDWSEETSSLDSEERPSRSVRPSNYLQQGFSSMSVDVPRVMNYGAEQDDEDDEDDDAFDDEMSSGSVGFDTSSNEMVAAT